MDDDDEDEEIFLINYHYQYNRIWKENWWRRSSNHWVIKKIVVIIFIFTCVKFGRLCCLEAFCAPSAGFISVLIGFQNYVEIFQKSL